MKNLKSKLMLITLVFLISIVISTSIFASNEQIQILQKSEKEYMIYLSGHLDESFEFAFSNDKNIDKQKLNFKAAAKDTEGTDTNYIAYINEELYTEFFDNTTYLWARTAKGEYFAEAIEIDLKNVIQEDEIELANNITKIIKVDTKNSVTTQEMQNDVKVTKTVGKVDILEEGTIYYQLVKLPSTENYNQFMKIAEKIANSKVENNMYARLEITSEFASLYEKLVPDIKDNNWVKVENNVILQPEDATQGEQYILWLKSENNNEIKIDAQFLTCFEDYKPEVISEKISTKLPVTYDSPVLFIILGILIVALIIVFVLRAKTNKEQSKH